MSSSRSAERLEKKLQNALRECQKRPENKRCADCKERLPQWVVTDFNTFVCTACSGIHREFSHRVKSISLATFSEDEVAGVKAGGNEVNNKLYLARYRPGHDLPEPEGGRAEKHREFIRTKYVDRRWYATPEDLEKDAQREKEREAARVKRDADRGKRDSASGGRGAVPKKPERASGGSTGRARRVSLDRGLRKVDPPKAGGVAAAVKPPPAPKKQVDLLDFLSDGPAPAPGPAPGPAQVQAPPPAQQWAAFSGGESAAGAIAPPLAPPATGGTPSFASWAAFGDAPAASQQQPPQQKQPQQAPSFAFQDGSTTQAQPASGSTFPALTFSTNFPATANADMGQQQKQQHQPWSQQQVSTVPAPAGLPQAGFPQAGSHGQQPQPPQHRAAFGAQATPNGGLSGTSPTVATLRPPPSPNATLFQAKPQPQPQPQQGFVQSGGDFTMSGARMSAPGTPVQQPQQVGAFSSGPSAVSGGAAGDFLNGGNAGTGFATSFEGLSLSSPAAGGVVAQQGGQGFPPHGHQRSGSQQGAIFSQGAGQPQAPYNPGAGHLQHSAFFGGGITPQQMSTHQPQHQAFAAFGQRPPFHQHPVGLPQYPQQQQQPQLQPHFQGPPGNGQGMQQQQQQIPQYSSPYQQQAAEGMGMGPSGPVQPPPAADVDPFAELAEGGGNGAGATGNVSSQEPPFRKGDEVLYIRGSDPPLEGVIQKVHAEEYPPYYTVLIAVTGREKNTDAAHLRHKKEGNEGVSNGRGHLNGQQRAGPDAFASLGAGAWGSTSTGATAVAAAPVRQQAGPQQPQAAPQQAGPHHATKQPVLAQGKEAMPSAGVGMAGGVGNPFRGVESPGLTAATGIAAGAAEQAGGNPFDMF